MLICRFPGIPDVDITQKKMSILHIVAYVNVLNWMNVSSIDAVNVLGDERASVICKKLVFLGSSSSSLLMLQRGLFLNNSTNDNTTPFLSDIFQLLHAHFFQGLSPGKLTRKNHEMLKKLWDINVSKWSFSFPWHFMGLSFLGSLVKEQNHSMFSKNDALSWMHYILYY